MYKNRVKVDTCEIELVNFGSVDQIVKESNKKTCTVEMGIEHSCANANVNLNGLLDI